MVIGCASGWLRSLEKVVADTIITPAYKDFDLDWYLENTVLYRFDHPELVKRGISYPVRRDLTPVFNQLLPLDIVLFLRTLVRRLRP